MENAHIKTPLEVGEYLRTDLRNGLTENEARVRKEKHGLNVISKEKSDSPVIIFFRQFNDFIIWVLIAAAFISGIILKEYIDMWAIIFVLFLNAILGFSQEYKAEKALESLKKMTAPTARVIRGGEEKIISSSEVVTGDIVLISGGDAIPADGRVVGVQSLRIDESLLTGESVSVNKTAEKLLSEKVTLGERKNMVFLGTNATLGRGRIVITNIGDHTEIGKIAKYVQIPKEKTPLQKELKKTGQIIAIFCIFLSVLIFALGYFRGFELAEMFLLAVSLAVASIPEGLPAAITVVLAIGVQRMAKKNAIVRRLHAVETLGATTYICSDKTGTLTQNKMKVQALAVGGEIHGPAEEAFKLMSGDEEIKKRINAILTVSALCNETRIVDGAYQGDPTEIALVEFAEGFGFKKSDLKKKLPLVREIPFDSERKMMSTVHQDKEGFLILTKGAPEKVLNLSKKISKNSSDLTGEEKEEIFQLNNRMASDGLRLLGIAYKKVNKLPEEISNENIEKDLIFMGVVGM
ncbi:MAG: HAD-IC family P-type ATPase, partial [Actinomycetia bacterium]|nr:HAD-IC family P-type ATPase [Actinomycetes bacterium]